MPCPCTDIRILPMPFPVPLRDKKTGHGEALSGPIVSFVLICSAGLPHRKDIAQRNPVLGIAVSP